MSKSKVKKTAINIYVVDDMIAWYQDMADDMGIPRSTAMVIALKTFQDQQDMLKLTKHLDK